MLTKQPNFYLVPYFVAIVRVLEQFLTLKYQNEQANNEGNKTFGNQKEIVKLIKAEDSKKDEVVIWNTFINTRIAPTSETPTENKK